MSFEPRVRGRRFGRPVAKKSARHRREQQESSIFYEEASPIDPSQIRTLTLNSLQHLGNQRFALPPFSEHFQRWVKDIRNLLSEFEAQLPEAVDQQYRESVEKTLSTLQVALGERTEVESLTSKQISDAQRQFATSENELSTLDRDYKTRTHEARRRYEQSFVKLRQEIDALDKERLRILHTKSSLLQRLFRSSETNLEKKANTIRTKRNVLGNRKEALKQDLESYRAEYESKRKQLAEQLITLRKKLDEFRGNKLDDALEIRKAACEELGREVTEAVNKLLKQQDLGSVEGAM